MIALRGVYKSFRTPRGPKVVAQGIDLDVIETGALALLGRNGAGKSTLLQMIAGTLPPDRGTIQTAGTISFPVAAKGALHPELTGADNARFVARIYGVNAKVLLKNVADFAELGVYFDMPLRSYSSGMRARLAFGISMAVRFDCYLIDEITSVGDQAFRRKSNAILRERLEYSSAIVVSHSMPEIRKLCHHAVVLEQGRLHYYDNIEAGIEAHTAILERLKPT